MRSKDFGVVEGISRESSKEETLEMFKRICLCRNFEFNVKKVFDQGLIKMPIYLSLGQESVAAALSVAFKNPAIFAQHRAHDLYLANGGDITQLIDELLHRPTGCAGGMGGSASIHSPKIGMFGHDGLMGTQIPISVGYTLATGKKTLAVMGDASAEEDYVHGAMAYGAHKKIPTLFVCTDNGLSILTKVEVRRNWKMVDVAKAYGMDTTEITDDPWLIMHHAKKLKLPAFMNVHTSRHLWHSGTGVDGPPEWDRFQMIKEEMTRLGLATEAENIEKEAKEFVDGVWEKQLALGVRD